MWILWWFRLYELTSFSVHELDPIMRTYFSFAFCMNYHLHCKHVWLSIAQFKSPIYHSSPMPTKSFTTGKCEVIFIHSSPHARYILALFAYIFRHLFDVEFLAKKSNLCANKAYISYLAYLKIYTIGAFFTMKIENCKAWLYVKYGRSSSLESKTIANRPQRRTKPKWDGMFCVHISILFRVHPWASNECTKILCAFCSQDMLYSM